ncbi:recombinase family protein [Tenacibaculum sp. UWU-22]|uniref:recombinase family protein n=1 Tax=Tenacibaculum sp. UWU-22 TaxID=3234187 RepID=UPI0034DB56F4
MFLKTSLFNLDPHLKTWKSCKKRGDSPEHHLDQAKTYAKLHNYEVAEIYDLTGVSGKTVKEHPECQRMLMDIHREHVSGFIFSKIARFTRNIIELLEFANFFLNILKKYLKVN